MEIANQEIYQQILDYIHKAYGTNIKNADTIRYGRASFTVKMLAECSYQTLENNPDKDMDQIVDFTFDYLCS